MLSLIKWTLIPAFASVWLILCGSANAQTRAATVQDDAGLFSKPALTKANAEIARVKSQFKKDLIIETVPKAPAQPQGLDVKNQKAVDQFFDDWAVQRARNRQVNGIYVVFVNDPKWKTVRVAVDKNTDKVGLFSRAHGEELRTIIVGRMKANDADGALVTAAEFVFDTMQRNSRPVAQANPNPLPAAQPAAQAEGIPWLKYVLIGIGVVFVLWLVMAVVRGFSGTGAAAQPGYGGGGGGGFMNGFLGGLFGAAAGMWMYNHFFGGHSSSAWASPPNVGPSSTDPGAAGDYYVSGGDYGSDKTEPGWGGGQDAGAGGGGDWGGGGGGDWGGGGGDW